MSTPPLDRFWRHVDQSGDCWIWTGARMGSTKPYPCFQASTRKADGKVYGHRWIYEQMVGPIPDGWHVDHLCRTPLCVRPDHLEAVTPEENWKRTRLSFCESGRHDLNDPEHAQFDRQGRRRGCRTCNAEGARVRMRDLYWRRRAEVGGQ